MSWHPELLTRGTRYEFVYEDDDGFHIENGRFRKLCFQDGELCAQFVQLVDGQAERFTFEVKGILGAREMEPS